MSIVKRFAWGLLPLFILIAVGCTKEIPAKSTVERQGRLYQVGADSPFTGVVIGKVRQARHSQNMTYKKTYKNGVLDGKSYYYYANGSIESIVPYTQGKVSGALICYWPNGKPKSRIYYVNGLRGGVGGEMFWDKNGHPL
jgi:antitoxin component YwqK of YwqJK toxin-antitoxin module